MTPAATQERSSDAASPASILTASDILKSHEQAVEGRKRSHDGELHLPQSILTTIEVIGSPDNIQAQRLAANLAALEAKTNGNTQNATSNTFSLTERGTLDKLAVDPPTVQTTSKDGLVNPQNKELGILSYRKAAFDDTSSHPSHKPKHPGTVISSIISHADGKYDDVNTQIIASIRQAHPGSRLIPLELANLDLFGFCFTGHAQLRILSSVSEGTGISHFFFAPPAKRTGSGSPNGGLGQIPQYEVGEINYKGVKWTLYFASWVKGFELIKRGYFVHDTLSGDAAIEQFVLECGMWTSTPKEQIWVFDQGFWQLDSALYRSVMKANWADIILPEDLKQNVLNDILGFYAAEETYKGLKMPWKRGVVFYGPPGNGKTITLKAIIKALYSPSESIPALPLPSLYVKTLASWSPPEYSIRAIFQKAREQSPCFLIWEDLDSIINDANRSFFLNELDGLEDNNGILVIGTTNHLDRLDPGIIKRPSRFDRKYLFDNPEDPERVRYVEYWRNKLGDTPIDFSDALVKELADLIKTSRLPT
ncbi:Spastin [Dactylellina cionopaga]|nr:Spastin [Dactylellina cionopaga]